MYPVLLCTACATQNSWKLNLVSAVDFRVCWRSSWWSRCHCTDKKMYPTTRKFSVVPAVADVPPHQRSGKIFHTDSVDGNSRERCKCATITCPHGKGTRKRETENDTTEKNLDQEPESARNLQQFQPVDFLVGGKATCLCSKVAPTSSQCTYECTPEKASQLTNQGPSCNHQLLNQQ